MHQHNVENWQHQHNFSGANENAERRTQYVLLLTAVTMVVEIVAGSVYGSMALLADGWHMGTHVAAFMITIFAYRFARKHADNPAYTFGTGKVSVLGGFASAVALGVVALIMLIESLLRIIEPQAIQFNEAIFVAILGLVINLVSAFLLKDHQHDHGHSHSHVDEQDQNYHEPDHGHNDHNLKAAYMHVLADALTSVLAIVALLSGKYFGWNWLDPIMGIVGALIISRWAYALIKQTGPILLDGSIEHKYKTAVTTTLENDADNKITDIHIWRVSADHYAAMISLVTQHPKNTEYYKSLLSDFDKLSHLTIEVNTCDGDTCRVK